MRFKSSVFAIFVRLVVPLGMVLSVLPASQVTSVAAAAPAAAPKPAPAAAPATCGTGDPGAVAGTCSVTVNGLNFPDGSALANYNFIVNLDNSKRSVPEDKEGLIELAPLVLDRL